VNSEDAIKRFITYKNDPWLFLSECVFTKDQADDGKIKPYPVELEYLRLIVMLWQREKRLAVPKSRRMIMSWTMIPLALWDCIFHKGKEWAFVSKKEDDSSELVARAEFIFNRIPPDKIPHALLPTIQGGKMTKSPPRLIFEFGNKQDKTQSESKIEGYPMGANQLRQFGFSGILGDEVAFWEGAEEFYSGAIPTLESVRSESGGGRMVLISSRAPGFFKRVVFDQVDNKANNFPEIPPAEVKRPMRGVDIWRNPKNKFLVVDLHYTADPLKATPEFREAIKANTPHYKFLREYEKSWETFEGMPCYPNFRGDLHCAKDKIGPHLGLPLLCSLDFGLTPACVVGQMQGNSLKIFREYTAQNEGIRTFMPKVLADLRMRYPEWPTKDLIFFVDPAGFQRAQTDERTCVMEISDAGCLNIEAGPVDWETRRSSVESFLIYIDKDSAGLEIDESNCPLLVEGFKGAYRYADSQNKIETTKPRPIKNIWSHPHDALQYLCFGARQKTNQIIMHIPTPQYSFLKQDSTTRRDPHGRRQPS